MTVNEALVLIRATPDPLEFNSNNRKVSCGSVVRVFEPDRRGLIEVLYLDNQKNPMTAYIRDRTVTIADGW